MLSPFTAASILQSGQVVIPVGARSFDIQCVSGSVRVNNTLLLAGKGLAMTMPDSRVELGTPIVVGISGLLNYTTVFYTV